MTVYITKYALTKGIFTVTGEKVADSATNMFRTIGPYVRYFHYSDWHESMQSACEQAEKIRLKKIESLKKQIAKLEKKKF